MSFEIIAPEKMPADLVESGVDTSIKPIDNEEDASSRIERKIASALIYLFLKHKLLVPATMPDETVAKGGTGTYRRRAPLTPYTKYATVYVMYTTDKSSGSVTGTVQVTSTSDGTGESRDIQDVNRTGLENNYATTAIPILVGSGDETDMGYEDVTITVSNTSSVASGNRDIQVIAIHVEPGAMRSATAPA